MLRDIRRLTGLNFLMTCTGAAAEADMSEAEKGILMAYWRQQTRRFLDAVGWQNEKIAMRAFPGGATLMVSAPPDGLYAATEIVEQGWAAAEAQKNDTTGPVFDEIVQDLIAQIADERNQNEIDLAEATASRGLTYLGNDKTVSVGLGSGSKVWNANELPEAKDVAWDSLYDVPIAMVTGTNGKSTTVRLAAAIGAAAGQTVGLSSSDWVKVGPDILDEGDYSGPAGARLAVRDPRVEMAIIETARGGLMRRGLPVPQADVCLLTNIAADHLGGYGITDVGALADAKFLLASAVRPGGRLVLNGDDPALVARSAKFDGDITWFGLDMDQSALENWISNGGHAVFLEDGCMVLARHGQRLPVMKVADFAPGLGGAAKFNISNALGAIGLTSALGVPIDAMTAGLSSFKGTPDENPGRGNFIEVGGVTLLIDFAHNAHGIAALADAVRDIPAKRRLFLAGQAGDRSDDDTRDMTRAIWRANPDHIIVKELPKKLRGRALGEIPAVISAEFEVLGGKRDSISVCDSEFGAVRKALEWAQAGDFLVLLLHDDRKPSMALIDDLVKGGWQAGTPLPD